MNFKQIFISVVKSMVFYALFAIAAFMDLKIEQINIKTTFLYRLINSEVYVKYPEGFNERRICRLKKALYDLKQSPYL